MAEEIHASAQDKPEEVKLPGADLFDWLQMVMGCILAAVLLALTNWVKPTKNLHPIVFIAASAVVGVVFRFAGV